SRNKLAANMAILDAHVADRKYVIGDAFTMGDIPLGTAVQRWFNLPIERENLRNLDAYYQRLQGRAAFKQYVDVLPLT
ncbi:MAG: glutathione S-transferase C-terminal domain-containing protein, partial [Pseudomonadota bacterium]